MAILRVADTLSTDDEWDDDDQPEVVEASWTLLHMLGSSSTCSRERENQWCGVN